MNQEDLGKKLGINAGRVSAIASQLGITTTSYTDEQQAAIASVASEMQRLGTGSIKEAIASLQKQHRATQPQQDASTSQEDSDRIGGVNSRRDRIVKNAIRMGAVEAAATESAARKYALDFLCNGIPAGILTEEELARLDQQEDESADFFSGEVVSSTDLTLLGNFLPEVKTRALSGSSAQKSLQPVG
jgi:hypothetical protein